MNRPNALHRLLAATVALLGIAVVGSSAQAADIFFNGVKVTGSLRSQSFKNCSVRFDDKGNVHITAKGYSVKKMEGKSGGASGDGAAAADEVAKNYYLFSKATRAGYAQYDVDVYINGKWVKKIRNGTEQVVTDVTKHLKRGKNVIHFAATKNYGGKPRQSQSAKDALKVFLGLGTKGGGTVNITRTLASFEATAARTDNFGEEKTVKVH